ncbi:hypothetical protein Tco_1275173 [Tanacetum coccineum]
MDWRTCLLRIVIFAAYVFCHLKWFITSELSAFLFRVGTNVTLMSNAQPNNRPDLGRAKEISQSKQLHTLCLSVSDTPIYVRMLSKHHAYIRIFQEYHRNMYNLENAAAHADIMALMMGLGFTRMLQRHLFLTIRTNVSFGNLEVFGLKGSLPQSCFDGKGGDAEVGSSSHIDGRTKNCGSTNFPPQGHLGLIMAGTEIRSDSVCKVETKKECGDGALDMTKLDSVGSGDIVTYDYVIEFFQKGEKIVECDGLGARDAEVEVRGKGEGKFVELDAILQKDNVELTDDNKESQTLVMDDLRNVSNLEDSETQLSHEAIQQLQTKATDDTTMKQIVDDDTECHNVVMDDDVLSTKDEAESAREVEQQLETDDLILGDVSESLIEDSESVATNMNDNVEKIDDNKESQTVVMDDVLNV